jgi:hypothetical protein
LIASLGRNYNRAMSPTSTDIDRLFALGASLRDFVLRAKRSLDDEIRSYPTPIPRCDAQFNYAYEQRARLAALSQQFESASSFDDGASVLRTFAEFAAVPSIGESCEEHALRVQIADELARAGVPIVANREGSASDLTAGSH